MDIALRGHAMNRTGKDRMSPASSAQSILIAGIGNVFLGDDAFGVEVARRLADREWPEGVRAVDFGIRGYDLAFALLDGLDLTTLVDATPRGGICREYST
jgi:Ni,Fe-hydrogenase maturation factor